MNQRHTGFTGYTSSVETNPDPSSTTNSPYLSRRNFGLGRVPVTVYAFDVAGDRIKQHLGSTQPREAPDLDDGLTPVSVPSGPPRPENDVSRRTNSLMLIIGVAKQLISARKEPLDNEKPSPASEYNRFEYAGLPAEVAVFIR